jgi:hypothetical protein
MLFQRTHTLVFSAPAFALSDLLLLVEDSLQLCMHAMLGLYDVLANYACCRARCTTEAAAAATPPLCSSIHL